MLTALEICPTDPKALFRRCQALEALGRVEEAYRDARNAMTSDPGNKALQPALARLHEQAQEKVNKIKLAFFFFFFFCLVFYFKIYVLKYLFLPYRCEKMPR
jgi:hypothetical protein